jgi:predicted Zn-dependent protease
MIFQIKQKGLNCILNLKTVLSNNLNIANKMLHNRLKNLFLLVGFVVSMSTQAQSLDEAIKHLDAERFDAANKAFTALTQSTPSPAAYFYKGYALLRSPEGVNADVIKDASAAFTAGNALDKKGDPMNQIGLGMVKLASKDVAGAKLIFEEVKKATKSKNTDVLYRIAEAYTMFAGATDPGEAIMNINMALEKSKAKDNPEYYIIKSDAYMLKNEGGDAMNALQNAERSGKKMGRIYEKMSRVWLQSRNYKEADGVIKKGIAADATHAPMYKYQSSYLQTMGKYADAAAAAKSYLSNSDGDCKAKVRYAKLAFIAKDFPSVRSTIDEVKSCSKDPYLYRMTGQMNFEAQKPKEAIEDLEKFIKTAPAEENKAMDYGFIGRSYLSMSGDAAAKKISDSLGIMNVEKAIQMGDTTFNYYNDMAGTFFKAKDYKKAAKYSEKAAMAKKSPTAADFATVGTYYNYDKNWIKADEYVDKALGLYKDGWIDGYALSARVKAYKNSADSTYSAGFKSASLYEKYLSLIAPSKMEPKNKRNVSEALMYLAGREFQVNKNNVKALEFLDEVVKIDSTNQTVLKQIDAIKGVKPLVPGTVPPPPPPAPAIKNK